MFYQYGTICRKIPGKMDPQQTKKATGIERSPSGREIHIDQAICKEKQVEPARNKPGTESLSQ